MIRATSFRGTAYVGSMAFLMLGVPLILCAIYSTLQLGSIGPWIPITGVANVILLPGLAIAAARAGAGSAPRTRRAFFAGLVGVACAVVGMNAFIGLTWLFGLGDYQLM